jgi:uncharacterized protein (DUF58 family)
MPTRRAWTFLILAGLLYLLANQTQVGWVYVMVAGLVGLLLLNFFYGWGLLKSLRASRNFHNLSPTTAGRSEPDLSLPTFHEDDPLEITLQVRHTGWRPLLLVSGTESCPCAPPAEQSQSLFISSLFKNQPLNLSYQTVCDRRGLYRFPPLALASSGPFGFFHAQRRLAVPGEILIYPYYVPLKRLRLLERRGYAQSHRLRVGAGDDLLGVRDYRPGDSLRHVHWRSTARRGKLVVKEFADEEELSLTVVLDLSAGGSVGQGKYATFETAVRLAATFGYYAAHKKIPFYLVGENQQQTVLKMPLSWWAVLNYLAKVQNNGVKPLSQLLDGLPTLPFVVVLISRPDEATAQALTALARRGVGTLAIFITPNGTLPETAAKLTGAELHVAAVSPRNWPELLAEM